MLIELLSTRLQFKELEEDDVPLVHQLNSYEEVARYNTIGVPKHIDETKGHMQANLDDLNMKTRTRYAWLMHAKSDGSFIGMIGLRVWPKRYSRGEIYYSIMPEQWGNGFASEAAEEVISFCFDTLSLHRIEAGVATNNIASIRVLEKVGMIREGIGREILPLSTGWQDNYSYSLLESDAR